MKKPTRTISGVSPIAVVIEPRKCPHGTCLYCPSLEVPQSYTPESPAIMRAKMLNYDPYMQVKARLKAFSAMGHSTNKIELIVMGGTFLAYPVNYQYDFIKKCYDALNGIESGSLEEAKRINENSAHRCVALCIETRPDVCEDEEIKRMLDFGTTRCELGVQILDDEIYRIVKRGHSVKDVREATKRLREKGFKIVYHIMPNLPGSSFENDIEKFEKIFEDEDFRPDGLKIYPCQVVKGSELEKIYYEGKYSPYDEERLIDLLIELKRRVPKYCRIMRVMREIPPSYLVAGTKRIDLRNLVRIEMEKRGLRCNCIRCREVGFAIRQGKDLDLNLSLEKIKYRANGGEEVFLSFVNSDDILFAICRLRLPDRGECAFIRELHVYGPEVEINKVEEGKVQHKGLGKKLLAEAERIARRRYKTLKVISGVGVRNYYRSLGYELDEEGYMVKNLVI
jgi:elongator complex protein 3